MLYLIFLILGPALIFLGAKTRGRGQPSVTMLVWTFIWLSVQVPGVLLELLKTKYDKLGLGGSPFVLFDLSTWNGLHYFLVIGLVVYGVGLLFMAVANNWPTYLLILAGVAMLEYDVLAFIVSVFIGSDYFFTAVIGVGLRFVIELWTGLMAYMSTVGIFLPVFGRRAQKAASSAPSASGDGETDFGSMPSTIYSMDGTTYYLRTNLGYGAEYVSSTDPDDTITITNVYSRTGSEMSTDAGHFRY